MKKQDFINTVHANANLEISRKLTGEIIDTTFNEITNILTANEGKFTYPGFGTFVVRTRKARKGRNPQTGEVIKIKASKSVGFRPAKALKERL